MMNTKFLKLSATIRMWLLVCRLIQLSKLSKISWSCEHRHRVVFMSKNHNT